MDDTPRYKLCELIKDIKLASSIDDDPRICKNLLNDHLLSEKKYQLGIFAIYQAAKHNIPSDLKASKGQHSLEVLINRLSKRLEDGAGLKSNLARWAVESWALALGLIKREQITPFKPEEKDNSKPQTPDQLPPIKKALTKKVLLTVIFGLIIVLVLGLVYGPKFFSQPDSVKVGSVTIRTYPDRAICYIDGKQVGWTPYEGKDIKRGTYRITVKKDGYKETTESVEVEGQRNHDIIIYLKPIDPPPVTIGRLEIASEPPGAKCYIDNKYVGITPMALESIEQGNHIVRIEKDGYEVIHNRGIYITPGRNHSIKEVMTPFKATLHITEPDGASVYLDRVPQGTAPIEIKNLSPGKTFLVRVEKGGYDAAEERIELQPAEKKLIPFKLRPISRPPISLPESPIDAIRSYYKGLSNRNANEVISRWKQPNETALRSAVQTAESYILNDVRIDDISSTFAKVWVDVTGKRINEKPERYTGPIEMEQVDGQWKIITMRKLQKSY